MHEKIYKWPIGPWPKDEQLKEAGTTNFQHWVAGMEGWCMWLLTRFGEPQPRTKEEVYKEEVYKEEVYVYVAQLRQELQNPYHHVWHRM